MQNLKYSGVSEENMDQETIDAMAQSLNDCSFVRVCQKA